LFLRATKAKNKTKNPKEKNPKEKIERMYKKNRMHV